MPRMTATFGSRLKQFREARGWSQEYVGFELGVSKATISKWETGRAEPRLVHLVAIRTLFAPDGLTLDYLVSNYPATRAQGTARRYVKEGPAETARSAQTKDELALLVRFRACSAARKRGLLDLLE